MSKIVKKRYVGIQPVYNMEVFGRHNYITPFGSILHNCRYFCISRVTSAETEKPAEIEEDEDDKTEDYESYMCGGSITDGYVGYAAG